MWHTVVLCVVLMLGLRSALADFSGRTATKEEIEIR